MTHPRNAPPVGASAAGGEAERAAFLRDLRALRDHAGLGPRDLAARAHFPESTLTMAEAGPALPSLPVLQAYVRGCGAAAAEWEDRWRRLNQDSISGSSALPTRAPATNRPPARVMPFPEPEVGRSAADQEAIGFGLARVVRGLTPIDPDPPRPGLGGSAAPADSSAASGGTGWFDPPPKVSPSMFDSSPASSSAPAPPAAPAAPAPDQELPTMQYPTLSSYGAPASYPAAYTTPEYQPPEEFRTPVPEPPSTPPPAPPGPSASLAGLATPAPVSPAWPTTSGTSASPGSSANPKAHAAPASPRRRIATGVIAAVIAVVIIAAVLWLVLPH